MSAGEMGAVYARDFEPYTASMRPRHVCRGNREVALLKAKDSLRFNEAPACLPGKCLDEILQRILRKHGFNEAPACLPGKCRPGPRCRLVGERASMRPRHVCRGNGTLRDISLFEDSMLQ